MDTTAALLRRIPLLASLLDDELATLAALLEPVDLLPGDVLAAEGETSGRAYVVAEGHADVTMRGARVSAVGPGALVGAMAVVETVPRTTSVVARTAMRVLAMDVARFWEVLCEPAIARRLSGSAAPVHAP